MISVIMILNRSIFYKSTLLGGLGFQQTNCAFVYQIPVDG